MTTNTTLLSFRLEPIQVQPGERLQPGLTHRPTLLLHPVTSPELCLGRNLTTGIDDGYVHRNAATLRLQHAKVWLHYGTSPQQARYKHAASISVNGQAPTANHSLQYQQPNHNNAAGTTPTEGGRGRHVMELHHGDVIAVEGRREPVPLRYVYQLQQVDLAPAAAAAASPASPSSTTAAAAAAASLPLPSSLFEPIGNEAMCAICMEIQVHSRSLVPCGHSFCQSCINSTITTAPTTQSTCPMCRKPMTNHVPNLALDNIIWSMIVAQSSGAEFFDESDIPTYLERSGKQLPVAQHHRRRQTPTKSPRSIGQQPKQTTSKRRKRKRGAPSNEDSHNHLHNNNNNIVISDPGQGTSVANAICLD